MENVAYCTQFEAHLITERRVAFNTVSAYKKDIAQFMQYLDENNIILLNCAVEDLRSFLQSVYDTRCKSRTIARKIASLKTFFNFIYEKHGIPNYAALLATPKNEVTLPRYLSEEEIHLLLTVAQNDTTLYALRNHTMIILLYSTGVRISELLSICTNDIRFDTKTILIHGKGNKQRVIPLTDDIIPLLHTYLQTLAVAHQGAGADIIFKSNRTSYYLFPSFYGNSKKPLSRQTFWQILKRLCTMAGIQRDISPHQLRHSLATHLLKRGANLRSLQLLLGHETLNTMHVYTHLDTSTLRSVYNKKHVRS
jgi:site-specific recombinase XerD